MIETLHARCLTEVVEERITRILGILEGKLEERGGVIPLPDGPHSHADYTIL